MASDARISTALPSHPKTKKLVRLLGGQAGWSLVCLILWAAANRSDGDLAGMSDEDIELASDWDGEEGQFIAALRRVRFVDGDELQSRIHDWTEHQPWASGAEARSLKGRWNAVKKHHGEAEADRQVPEYASIRHASAKKTACTQDAASTHAAQEQDAPIPAPYPTPYPTPTEEMQPAAAAPSPRAKQMPCPDDVDSQVWADWLQLRKAKKAPVTQTVVDGARREAAKAGMGFEAFLSVWCQRGSQGLQADWLKPHERAGPPTGRLDRQLQTAALLTGATPATHKPTEAIDVESRTVSVIPA